MTTKYWGVIGRELQGTGMRRKFKKKIKILKSVEISYYRNWFSAIRANRPETLL